MPLPIQASGPAGPSHWASGTPRQKKERFLSSLASRVGPSQGNQASEGHIVSWSALTARNASVCHVSLSDFCRN